MEVSNGRDKMVKIALSARTPYSAPNLPTMTSELIRQRSDLIDTQVIAKDTGKRLGIVKELLVDIDSREVVALGLRDGWLAISTSSSLTIPSRLPVSLAIT